MTEYLHPRRKDRAKDEEWIKAFSKKSCEKKGGVWVGKKTKAKSAKKTKPSTK